jgi:hypothetical protein
MREKQTGGKIRLELRILPRWLQADAGGRSEKEENRDTCRRQGIKGL